jgi:hypothetical protein
MPELSVAKALPEWMQAESQYLRLKRLLLSVPGVFSVHASAHAKTAGQKLRTMKRSFSRVGTKGKDDETKKTV